ncbi:DUF6783 domain-containing protein [Robinsoniella peoriensis]
MTGTYSTKKPAGPSIRARLKIAFWQLRVTVCGRFVPNEGRVAGYVT